MGFQLTQPPKFSFSSGRMKIQNSSSSCCGFAKEFFGSLTTFLRRCLFRILSVGPIPKHIAFIMDGNRRYAKNKNLEVGAGHRAGFLALMSILKYCYELRVKYVTIYALNIDNFNRKPDEVQRLMDLMLEKIEGLLKEESIVNHYGIRVYFIGDLKLLDEPVRIAAENVMRATANNTKCVLLICVAYTSCNEIVHAVQESCTDKRKEFEPFSSGTTCNGMIKELHHDKHNSMYNGHEANDFIAMKSSTACNVFDRIGEGTDTKNCMVEQYGHGHRNGRRGEADALKVSRTANGANAAEMSEKMLRKPSIIKAVDIEKHMPMSVAPTVHCFPGKYSGRKSAYGSWCGEYLLTNVTILIWRRKGSSFDKV